MIEILKKATSTAPTKIGGEYRITLSNGRSNGRKYGIFKMARLVFCSTDTSIKHHRQKNIIVLEAHEVNIINDGKRSNYNKTLKILRQKMDKFLEADFQEYKNVYNSLPSRTTNRI